MARFCENCGNKIEENEQFCSQCGNKVNKPDNTVSVNNNQNNINKTKNGLSTAGFICSIIGFVTCGTTSLIGLILSCIGLSKSKKNGNKDTLALAGIILSIFPLIFFIAAIFIGFYQEMTAKDVEVIDLSTMSKEEIEKWCDENKLDCDFKKEYSDTVPTDGFISQEYEPGQTIKEYDSFEIHYSKGKINQSINNTPKTTKTPTPKKTSEEIKSEYKASCADYGYKDIARQPDEYKGKKGHFRGKVLQVSEGIINSNKIDLRVNVTEGEYGFWEDTVLVTYTYKDGETKILEDDIINIYGTIEGTTTYISVLGAKVTVPSMKAEYIEIG